MAENLILMMFQGQKSLQNTPLYRVYTLLKNNLPFLRVYEKVNLEGGPNCFDQDFESNNLIIGVLIRLNELTSRKS